jgi:hypothetical protein
VYFNLIAQQHPHKQNKKKMKINAILKRVQVYDELELEIELATVVARN